MGSERGYILDRLSLDSSTRTIPRRTMLRRSHTLALVFAVLFAAAQPTSAQDLTRPSRDWQSVETAHFRLHFPAEMRTGSCRSPSAWNRMRRR
jgi:hypothetical protein